MASSGFNPLMAQAANAPQSWSNLLYGMFGDAGAPYRKAEGTLDQYAPEAKGYEQPFYNAGTQAIPQYQDWLKTQQDPSGFINHLMGQYQQSPYMQFMQQQSQRAGTNAASANGLTGSTPFALQMQQNAGNIAQGGMNDWLQHVLGINTQYGAGTGNLMNSGRESANSLADLTSGFASSKAGLDFGNEYAKEQQKGSMLSGFSNLFL